MEMIIGMIKQYKYMYSLRIQYYFEYFNWLRFSLRNHFSKNTIRAPNSLDPDQVPYFGGPDLGSKCLQSRRYHEQS